MCYSYESLCIYLKSLSWCCVEVKYCILCNTPVHNIHTRITGFTNHLIHNKVIVTQKRNKDFTTDMLLLLDLY